MLKYSALVALAAASAANLPVKGKNTITRDAALKDIAAGVARLKAINDAHAMEKEYSIQEKFHGHVRACHTVLKGKFASLREEGDNLYDKGSDRLYEQFTEKENGTVSKTDVEFWGEASFVGRGKNKFKRIGTIIATKTERAHTLFKTLHQKDKDDDSHFTGTEKAWDETEKILKWLAESNYGAKNFEGDSKYVKISNQLAESIPRLQQLMKVCSYDEVHGKDSQIYKGGSTLGMYYEDFDFEDFEDFLV